MRSELEKDVLEAESFPELMINMERKGIYVPEHVVVDRLLDFIVPDHKYILEISASCSIPGCTKRSCT